MSNKFDFIIFPILWSILQAHYHGTVTTAWSPITLNGGAMFHVAMGAVLGITSWSRSQEKLSGLQNKNSVDPS